MKAAQGDVFPAPLRQLETTDDKVQQETQSATLSGSAKTPTEEETGDNRTTVHSLACG